MKKPLKIGHRGAKAYVAENTLASVEKALELGVQGIEIDVHKCASGELVVFHDFTLDRMTNGQGEVSKHTLSELKQLKVKDQFSIPTLEDVLKTIDRKCMLNIELKGKDTADGTCNVIDKYMNDYRWTIEDFLISSFQYHELEKVNTINSNLRLGVLTKASVTDALEFANTINAYAIHPNFALLTKENVKRAQKENYKVVTWTVNDHETIQRMTTYGVDAVISDNPDRL
ncbi:glycerophosphodiester phosphodiesterase family protein [uncultured Psychroserpens sp.]|uniref:glycerophosphodiester phosphodiesterase n=1 Tax=uncultured Psychroserpens sp. TaxID=255436 RepID=UPI00261D699F|nr:glycerophosphodiester phosphodiesterase family protein [uncultured Psychroserpens sp.]